jgi:hypothetical protein
MFETVMDEEDSLPALSRTDTLYVPFEDTCHELDDPYPPPLKEKPATPERSSEADALTVTPSSVHESVLLDSDRLGADLSIFDTVTDSVTDWPFDPFTVKEYVPFELTVALVPEPPPLKDTEVTEKVGSVTETLTETVTSEFVHSDEDAPAETVAADAPSLMPQALSTTE